MTLLFGIICLIGATGFAIYNVYERWWLFHQLSVTLAVVGLVLLSFTNY